MKTNYFTKVENKYVFNISLIFWHLFILLSSLGIVIALLVFLWSIIPSAHKKVVKQPYPAMGKFPPSVKVTLNELNLNEVKKEKAPQVAPEPVQTKPKSNEVAVVDTAGEYNYNKSINTLKKLIPPSKYQWHSSGFWKYPYGKRYWEFYKQDKYRKWVITKYGINDKLGFIYKKVNAKNFYDKSQILEGFISVAKILPEPKRWKALQYLMNNVSKKIQRNINVYQSIIKVEEKMKQVDEITYLNTLLRFAKKNPKDGITFIDYVAKIIGKFDVSQRANIINSLTKSYYNNFKQNFAEQQEATNLFLPLVVQIKAKLQPRALMQYNGLYLKKRDDRNKTIDRIKQEHQQAINNINNQYYDEKKEAKIEYFAKQQIKEKLRNKSIEGIAGGIVLIVLIGTILVFLSIQRSVRKIEEKLNNNYMNKL